MLNGHDTSVCKDLLGEVVDELSVDEAVEALADDVLHLGAHLLLLCLLYICHLHRHTPGIIIAVVILRKTKECHKYCSFSLQINLLQSAEFTSKII